MKKESTKLPENDILSITVIVSRFFIKSKTNNGELAKQYFTSIRSEICEPSLSIKKLVFTDDKELYNNFKLLKTYKGKYLLEQRFGIKLSMLNTVIAALNAVE